MRHPFRNLVIVLLALGIMATFAMSILLPPLMVSRLQTEALQRQGLKLVVEGRSSLSFHNGLAVELNDVTLTHSDVQAVPLASIGRMIVATPLSKLIEGTPTRDITLIDPVFTFSSGAAVSAAGETTSSGGASAPKIFGKPFKITIQNGSVKAEDSAHDLVMSASDISGQLQQGEDGTLQMDGRGLFNGQPTNIVVTVDDVVRLRQSGSPADLTLTSKAGQIALSGRLGLAGDLGFDGSVSAEAADMRGFLAWLGLDLKGLRSATAFNLDGGISLARSKASLKNLSFALGAMQAKGKVEVQARGQRPLVFADLTFDLLDLNLYKQKSAAGVASAPPDLTAQWSEQTLPMADLLSIDGKVQLKADRVVVGAVEAGAATLTATVQKGALQAQLQTSELAGGTGNLDFSLVHGDASEMKLKLDVAGVAAQDFLHKAFGVGFLSGPIDAVIDVSAKGQHVAQLVSSLTGSAKVTLRNGSLDGFDLAERVGLLKGDDIEGWGLAAGRATTLTSLEATAVFSDGIATLAGTRLETAGVTADVAGQVDLLRRAVDLKVTPGGGLYLPVAATAKGGWDNPKLSAKLDVDTDLRDSAVEAVPEAAENLAKGTVKKAKKKLKKLFGN